MESHHLTEKSVGMAVEAANMCTYTALVNAFKEMQSIGCKANICTYTALVNAFGREGLCEKAEQVFEEMQQAGHEPDVYAYNALMEAYR